MSMYLPIIPTQPISSHFLPKLSSPLPLMCVCLLCVCVCLGPIHFLHFPPHLSTLQTPNTTTTYKLREQDRTWRQVEKEKKMMYVHAEIHTVNLPYIEIPGYLS